MLGKRAIARRREDGSEADRVLDGRRSAPIANAYRTKLTCACDANLDDGKVDWKMA